MYRAKTKTQFVSSAVNSLAAKSSISQLNPGSKARAIVEALGEMVGSISEDMSDGNSQTLLSNANGVVLDAIASSYGLQRLESVSPKIESGDNNLKYYVRRGTFGDINRGNGIVVPKGTQIRSSAPNNTIFFIQRSDVTLPAGSSSVYFSADQLGSSVITSFTQDTLTQHNFAGYAESAYNSLLVTNEKGTAGRPRESDNNLRFRIRSLFTSSMTSNFTAVRLAALATPGVSDIRVVPGRSGLGTFDVIVYGITPVVSNSLLNEVQARIDRVCAVGTRGIAVSPNLVGISLQTTILFAAGTEVAVKNRLVGLAEDIAREYIDGLQPGQTFSINNLAQRIIGLDPSIIDIGSPGYPFNDLLIWRQNNSNSRRFSRKLITNYNIQVDEEMVVEPFIESPIMITGN